MFTFNEPSTCSLLRNFGLSAVEPTQNVCTQGLSAQFSRILGWVYGKKCVHIDAQLSLVPTHQVWTLHLQKGKKAVCVLTWHLSIPYLPQNITAAKKCFARYWYLFRFSYHSWYGTETVGGESTNGKEKKKNNKERQLCAHSFPHSGSWTLTLWRFTNKRTLQLSRKRSVLFNTFQWLGICFAFLYNGPNVKDTTRKFQVKLDLASDY